MADSEVKVVISGEAQGVVAAMQEASAAVKEGIVSIKESLESVKGAFEGISSGFAAIGALFAGGIFKEVIASTNEWTEAAIQMGLALGISSQQASAWNIAIREVGGTSEDVSSAAQHLTRQLKTNEKGLNDMGIATRDSKGELLDMNTIMESAIEVVNSYEAGTDRNLAAQTAFGRGVNGNSAILRVHSDMLAEAQKRADELGLSVGTTMKAAFEAQRKAMADVNLIGVSMSAQIGQSLIPALLQLAQAFSGQASPMAQAFGQVITWVGQAVLGLWYGLRELGTMIGGLAAAVGSLAKGDLSGFRTIMGQLRTDLKAMSDEGDNAIRKLGQAAAVAKETAGGEEEGGHKKFNLAQKDEAGPDNRLALFKNALEQMNQARGDFDAKDIQADLQYWQAILANTTGNSKEDVKLRAEISKEILALNKKQHDEDLKESEEYEKTVQALQLGEVDAKKEALTQAFALGKITQAQELAGEVELENEKYAIQKKALDDKLALLQFDQLAQQKVKDQELLLEQKHAADVQKLLDKSAQEQNKTWQSLFSSMQSGFASTISGFLKGTTSLAATIKGLFADIGNAIIQTLANMAAKYLATSLMQLLESKTNAYSIIAALAAQAGAGAFAATAAIPIVGPGLAPAAGTLAFNEAMAYQAAASAAGGFDIPAGLNPVTQLHAQEMVLPASLANKVRSGQGIGGGGITFNVSAIDPQSFQKWVRQNNGAFAAAMKGVAGRFSLS